MTVFKIIRVSFTFLNWFVLFLGSVACKQFLISFLMFSFCNTLCAFCFVLSSLPSSIKFLLLMQRILLWFFYLNHLILNQLFFCFFLSGIVCLVYSLKCQKFVENFQQCVYKYHLFLCIQWNHITWFCVFLFIFWFNIIILKLVEYYFA